MKRCMLPLFLVLLLLPLVACGANENGKADSAQTSQGEASQPQTSSTAAGETKNVKIFNFQSDIGEQLTTLMGEYEKLNPNIRIEVESVLGTDYNTALKTKFAANAMPDIFQNGGYKQLDTWINELEDLSDQPWVSDVFDTARNGISKDGKIYGMPSCIEGYGYIYNKDLFKKANITKLPTTLTELEEAVKKLESAGVTPFVNYFQLVTTLGKQFINTPFVKQPDADAFIAGLNSGTAGFENNRIFDDALNLLDLNANYSVEKGLTTDFNTAIAAFAGGEAAIMQSGNWLVPQIHRVNPNVDIGLMTMPLNDDVELNDKLFVDVPVSWVINIKSKVKPEAKEILNWMVTSDAGKKAIASEFKFIPALETIPIDEAAIGEAGAVIREYVKENKACGWDFYKFPDGAVEEFGATLQKYIAGKINRDQVYKEFGETWQKLK